MAPDRDRALYFRPTSPLNAAEGLGVPPGLPGLFSSRRQQAIDRSSPNLETLGDLGGAQALGLEGGGKADDQALMRGAALRMMLVKRRSVARSTRVGLAHISALARIPVKIASIIAAYNLIRFGKLHRIFQ
jgi:hypothetical protein